MHMLEGSVVMEVPFIWLSQAEVPNELVAGAMSALSVTKIGRHLMESNIMNLVV